MSGNVDVHAVGWLLIGSIPGVLIGSQLIVSVPDRNLRIVLAAVLLISGVKIINPHGSNWIAACGAVAVVAAGIVAVRRLPGAEVLDPSREGARVESGGR